MPVPYPFVLPESCFPRLWSKVSWPNETDCRDWLGAPTTGGYGRFYFNDADGNNREVRAHNAMWVSIMGDFPPHLEPDHLCNRTICVEPEHIEWVTGAENNRRRALRRARILSEYCHSGLHRWDEQLPIPGMNGARICRVCRDGKYFPRVPKNPDNRPPLTAKQLAERTARQRARVLGDVARMKQQGKW